MINFEITKKRSQSLVLENEVAQENVAKGEPVKLNGPTGRWQRADASDPAKMPANGVALASALAGAQLRVALGGEVPGLVFPGAARGKRLYVRPGGGSDVTIPTATGAQIQNVGFVKSAVAMVVTLRDDVEI